MVNSSPASATCRYMSSWESNSHPVHEGAFKTSSGLTPGAFFHHKPRAAECRRITEHLMDCSDLEPVQKCKQKHSKMPLWIIEYIWAHKMTDVQEVVDPSIWPEMDSEPMSLEDSWRLRVASAQVYSIVKNREVEHFERVMDFLETTFRLLPRLVASIKHMKIMFGLKTMAIMGILRKGRGMVDTVLKINQFFPSKLPQYQDKCSHHEMFLMRKAHLDFKALAQGLAMDKDKLEDYIMNHMEEQYGEHYAQKLEDRLLHYLHKLEAMLPGDTYIDKLLKKNDPVTEEEKLLLEVITSDSTTVVTTLKKLLHCDVASCRPCSVSQSSENGKNGMKSSQLVKSALHASSAQALFRSVETKTPPDFQPDVFRRGEEDDQEQDKDSPLLLENDKDSDVRIHQQTEEDGEGVHRVDEESSGSVQESTSSPQFCAKHQRWVKSILQECPDECSEELLLRANFSLSPPLFQSSSSTTSSQDLTPSGLIPLPADQQGPQTSTHLQTAAQACDQAKPEDKVISGSPASTDAFQMEPQPQPSSSRDNLLPTLMLPVVRLVDIASVSGIHLTLKPHQASSNHFTMSSYKQAASTSRSRVLGSTQCHSSESNATLQRTTKHLAYYQQETMAPVIPVNTTHPVHNAPISQDASTSCCQVATQQSLSRLSEKLRQACTTTVQSQALDGTSENPLAEQFKSCPPLPDDLNVSGPLTQDAYTSTFHSGALSSVCMANHIPSSTESSQHPQTCNISPFQSKTQPYTVTSPTSESSCVSVSSETSRVQRNQMGLSESSQAMLLESKLLQAYVSLTRLRAQDCYQVTKGRCSTRSGEPVVQGSSHDDDKKRRKEEEEDADSFFDPNILYSSYSSTTDVEDLLDCDPDYKPLH